MKTNVKPCTRCGVMGHSAFNCFGKPKKPLSIKKHMRKVGKVGRQWIATRLEWISKNLPDNGHWDCTYCGVELHLNTLTLDHKQSRSRHPELRFDLDNLTPACWSCNHDKGSKSFEEYMNATD